MDRSRLFVWSVLFLFLGVTLSQADLHRVKKRSLPSFDDRNQPNLRGVIDDTVELPCAVRNLSPYYQVSWSKLSDSGAKEVLTVGHKTVTRDPRISIRYGAGELSWYLTIEHSEGSDEGDYVCEVSTPKILSKTFHLVMIPDDVSRLWRTDSRCGRYDTQPYSSQRAECDPYGAYPCCSSGGWCGFTSAHCDCRDCIDYKDLYPPPTTTTAAPEPACPAPFVLLSALDKCVLYPKKRRSWRDAEQFCRTNGGELYTFDSLDDLTEEALHIVNNGENGEKYWVNLSTEGRRTNSDNVWRWLFQIPDFENEIDRQCTSVGQHQSNAYGREDDCGALLLPLCHIARDGDATTLE